MNKVKISSILLSVLLISMSSMFIDLVSGQNGAVSIKFKAQAGGSCLTGYGGVNPLMPVPRIWSGLGDGTARIDGVAEATPYKAYFVDGAYTSQSVRASGLVAFDWVEENGFKHHVEATISSNISNSMHAIFLPKDDYFNSPLFESSSFTFTGTHKAGSTSQDISGPAIFMSSWLGWSPQLYHPGSVPINVINIMLIDQNTQTMYAAIWSSEETPMPPLTPLIVPAADIFERSVEITAWDPGYYFKASFKASTKGDCVVVCNARETTSDCLTLGGGKFSFQGKAVAELSQYLLPPDSIPLYDVVAGTMEASGEFQASWADNEGNPYKLQIRMSPSLSYPYSQLEPNRDYMIFSAMILSQGLRMPFDYTGTLKRGSETFNIQGKCGFMVVPVTYFTPPEYVNPPDSNELFFYVQTFWGGKSNGYHFGWADKDTHVTLGDYDLHLLAAETFKHEVTFSNP